MPFWETVNWILESDYPRKSRKYRRAHRIANEWEKKKYGIQKFKSLNSIINKVIPKGQLAGDNTKRGKIKVSGYVPAGRRGQVHFHEDVESKILRGWKIVGHTGLGESLRIKWERPKINHHGLRRERAIPQENPKSNGIKAAIKDEKSAIPMYRGIKKTLEAKGDKETIDKIIQDERKHKVWLERIKEARIKEAMRHRDVLGAGARKREKMNLTPAEKRSVVMREFYRRTLHSGSGEIVTDPQQAKAIAYSESRKIKA